MAELIAAFGSLELAWRVLILVAIAVLAHVVVIAAEHATLWYSQRGSRLRLRRLQSLATLLASAIVFALYFLIIGLILAEFGVSLTAYLASASVLGLAIGFGSQGLVQDVVTGLTLIFSDLIDVGDLVEVSGQTGIVRGVTMRFVELENALGGTVFVPNRTISSVINYPRGYVRCFVDVTLVGDASVRERMQAHAARLMSSFAREFPGLIVREPTVSEPQRLDSGKEFLRIKFRIWPNRGGPIETTFRHELAALLEGEHADYQPWMIAVVYEAETRALATRSPLPWLLGRARSPATAAAGEREHHHGATAPRRDAIGNLKRPDPHRGPG
jgi:small conductance mechanosensitive channel